MAMFANGKAHPSAWGPVRSAHPFQGGQIDIDPFTIWASGFSGGIGQLFVTNTQGLFSLSVTIPGQEPAVFSNLETSQASWKTLNWCGFVSTATERTSPIGRELIIVSP